MSAVRWILVLLGIALGAIAFGLFFATVFCFFMKYWHML